jgi:GMP synthase (glutamine-hydrolysing)
VLVRHGITIETVELDEGGRLPDWRDVDLVVVMGGPMGVYDEAEHPWLAAEKRWIAAAVRAGVPYFGVCLGAQLLAASLGAQVRAGSVPEVGVLPVTLTEAGRADPVASVMGREFLALQWHGDTFDIPAGAVRLGQSPAYPHQAMRFGDVAYAVQFHVEVTDPMFAEWRHVPAYAASAQAALGASGFDSLARAFAESRDAMAESADRLFHTWLRQADIHCSETMLTEGNRLQLRRRGRPCAGARAPDSGAPQSPPGGVRTPARDTCPAPPLPLWIIERRTPAAWRRRLRRVTAV